MFEWDEFKNAANLEKHGIRFEEAISIFEDEHSLELIDAVHPERLVRIGFSMNRGLLVVIYCERNESIIRIISARKATKQEARTYAKRV